MHLFLGYNMGIRILYNVKYTTYIICGLFFFFFFGVGIERFFTLCISVQF